MFILGRIFPPEKSITSPSTWSLHENSKVCNVANSSSWNFIRIFCYSLHVFLPKILLHFFQKSLLNWEFSTIFCDSVLSECIENTFPETLWIPLRFSSIILSKISLLIPLPMLSEMAPIIAWVVFLLGQTFFAAQFEMSNVNLFVAEFVDEFLSDREERLSVYIRILAIQGYNVTYVHT